MQTTTEHLTCSSGGASACSVFLGRKMLAARALMAAEVTGRYLLSILLAKLAIWQ